jgi:hypothetical protein
MEFPVNESERPVLVNFDDDEGPQPESGGRPMSGSEPRVYRNFDDDIDPTPKPKKVRMTQKRREETMLKDLASRIRPATHAAPIPGWDETRIGRDGRRKESPDTT